AADHSGGPPTVLEPTAKSVDALLKVVAGRHGLLIDAGHHRRNGAQVRFRQSQQVPKLPKFAFDVQSVAEATAIVSGHGPPPSRSAPTSPAMALRNRSSAR